ncbi:MAG: BlaI/MecI/CopY family transcriptional regulator [Lachnospiraceae bacterium]|nr:BlaI/MecI/CopY family transcriptional regulator [Lachnospiraceae bacterium]
MEFEIGAVQEKFMDLIWKNEPLGSGELVKHCEKELNWKKPTTYTVLRRLCEKGLLQNQNGEVTSLISRDTYYSAKSERVVEDSYEGSLPAFVAAFLSRGKITKKEADEIQKMIEDYRKEAGE